MNSDSPLQPSESPSTDGLSASSRQPGFWLRAIAIVDRANLPLLASAVTFDAILAIVPLAVLVVGGLGMLLRETGYFGATDPTQMIARFFPLTGNGSAGAAQTSELMRTLLERISTSGGQFTLYAAPAFLWFSTRLFASLRTALTRIFNLHEPPHRRGVVIGYLLSYLRGKLRDFFLVGGVFILALLSTVLTAVLSYVGQAEAYLRPPWTLMVSGLGQVAAQLLAFGSGLALFTLLYRYVSPKRTAWRYSLLAGSIAAVAFELAKFLYSLYVERMGGSLLFSIGANIGAVLLLILWIWYTGMVFLLGAVIAEALDRAQSPSQAE